MPFSFIKHLVSTGNRLNVSFINIAITHHHQGFDPSGMEAAARVWQACCPKISHHSIQRAMKCSKQLTKDMVIRCAATFLCFVRIWTPLQSYPSCSVIKRKLQSQLHQMSIFKPLTAFTSHACNLQQIDQGLLFILMPKCIILFLL